MKASAFKYGLLSFTLTLLTVILVLLPFHAFLTIWFSTFVSHYTALRLWDEVLASICGLGVIYLLFFDHKVRHHTLSRKLTWLIVAYVAVELIWAAVALHAHGVSPKAAAYGVLVDLRFLAFFLITWAVAVRTDRLERRWLRILLYPAIIVVGFGLLQITVLPRDFLSHFGYGPHTIRPYETINRNVHYIRIMSTLRGANPLGVYLLLPISALVVLLVRSPGTWNWKKSLFLIGSVVVLIFSFSRGAWIGCVLSILTVLLVTQINIIKRHARAIGIAVGLGVVVLAIAILSVYHSPRFQSVVFHTQANSAIKTNSDGKHKSALRAGFNELIHKPFGEGPGTSGPASEYNKGHSAGIPENYFLQIGDETGWLGLLLFLLVYGTVGYLLWLRRASPLALTLFASLVGITFVNLLSQAWTDDTLSYLWWGLAGVAIAMPVRRPGKKVSHETQSSD